MEFLNLRYIKYLCMKNNPVKKKRKEKSPTRSNFSICRSEKPWHVEKWNPLKGIYKERKREEREGVKKISHVEWYTIVNRAIPRKDIYVHIFFPEDPSLPLLEARIKSQD